LGEGRPKGLHYTRLNAPDFAGKISGA
jgi:hypothetical protein